MKTLYTGKTKNVLLDEENKIVHLLFKDDMTGENGVFDPGSNTVGGSVAGKGKIGLAISKYFFELMEKEDRFFSLKLCYEGDKLVSHTLEF